MFFDIIGILCFVNGMVRGEIFWDYLLFLLLMRKEVFENVDLVIFVGIFLDFCMKFGCFIFFGVFIV